MKIIDIVKDLDVPVDFYAKALYDWDAHNNKEAQSLSDVNKERGFLKMFRDENGNRAYILKSKNQSKLPEEFKNEYTKATQNLIDELLTKDFYFVGILESNCSFEELYFPDEIFLTLEEAVSGFAKFLTSI